MNQMPPRLRVGVIGCGGIAQMMHLPYLYGSPSLFELVALGDLSARVLQALGEKYQVPPERRFTRYQDLLALPLDAVLILTSGNHYAPVLAALRAGKHVFVEKPLCFTVSEADALIDASRAANVKLMVGYMKRYDPGYLYALRRVQAMSDIRYVQINTLHPEETGYLGIHGLIRANDIAPDVLKPLLDADDASTVQAVGNVEPRLRETYSNVFLGSSVHDVNALRGLLGEPRGVLFADAWFSSKGDVSITTTLDYAEATRVVYTWTYLPDLRNYFQEIAVMSPANRVRIQFPSPYLRHFPTPIVVEGMEGDAAYEQRVTASYDEAFHQEVVAFHDCVVNDKQPLTGARDARLDTVLLQKIFAAMHPQGLGGEAGQYK
jgi:predicted dehydrogenase